MVKKKAEVHGYAVHLVGKDGLLKEGIRSLLAKTDFCLAGDYGTAKESPGTATTNDPVRIVIGIDDGHEDRAAMASALKERYGGSRTVIVSPRSDPQGISAVLAAGADGYILKDISCESLVHSLRLVMSGEKAFPASTLLTGAESAAFHPHLSERELQIVHRLASGEPNKLIAVNLNIAEATVKAHVKTVLRKLGAANRTQAAIMAISRGLAPAPERIAV